MNKKYLFGLDLIKVLAIVGVICFHLLDFQNGYLASIALEKGQVLAYFIDTGKGDVTSGFYAMLMVLGLSGVNLFFIASGFGLEKSQKKQPLIWQDFFIRRFKKLLPLYWAFLLMTLGYFLLTGMEVSAGDYITHLLGLHTLFPEFRFGISGPLWFMGTLIQLYCLFPIFNKLLKKYHKLPFVIGLILVHLASWLWLEELFPRIIPPTHYFWEFGLGMVLANVDIDKLIKYLKTPFIFVGLLFTATFALITAAGGVFYTVDAGIMRLGLSLISSICFVSLIGIKANSSRIQNVFSSLSAIIFAVYLFHQPLIVMFLGIIKDWPFTVALCTALFAVGVFAMLVTKIEITLTEYLRRSFARQIKG